MNFEIGNYVSRTSHNNDIVFIITDIKNDIAILKGTSVRLVADSPLEDLNIVEDVDREDFDVDVDELLQDRNEFFYLPGKILHIDGDKDYLNRCMEFYKKANVYAVGKNIKEEAISTNIGSLLKNYNPDIVIITGHDAFYKRNKNKEDINNYKNSSNFVNAVRVARNYEKSHEKLVIIAGACQSDYEELIKAGANFASSPKRVNIHALDPAIIAVTLALTERSKEVDLVKVLNKTKYGINGMGGLKSNGLMYVGYPR